LFCAWHDWNGDTSLTGGPVTSPDGDIAFTNMPYVTDVPHAGADCGANFVRSGSAGKLDGVSIIAGHEYAETITDQNPPGGWVDLGGEEAADKCAWKQTGTGQVALLTLPTGTFAMQGVWANNASSGKGGCRFTQTIKGTELLRNPGFETGKLAPWVATAGVLKKKSSSFPVHAGNWLARLGGRTAPHTDTLAQTVTVAPANGTYGAATFSFWLEIKTDDPADTASDTLTVQVLDASGTVVKQTLHLYSNQDAVAHYVQRSFSLNSFLGQTIVLKFTGTQTLAGHSTSFLIDDTALNAS
jgi:serine protease